MSAETEYRADTPRKGRRASAKVTTPSAQSEKTTPLKGSGWIGEASVSYGLSEANAKSQPTASGVTHSLLLLPGYSSQKPFRPVPAKTALKFPLPPCGRERLGLGPGPNDSRNTTSGAGGVEGRGLVVVPPPPPPPPPAPPRAK